MDNLVSSPNEQTYLIDNPCGSGTVLFTDRAVPKTGKIRFMTDVVTPRWYSRLRAKKFVFNPLSVTEETTSYQGTGGEVVITGVPCGGGGLSRNTYNDQFLHFNMARDVFFGQTAWGTINLCKTSDISGSDIASAVRELSTKARSKVKTGDTQGLESLAQFRQTLQLVRNPLEGAQKLTTAFTKALSRPLSAQKRGFELTNDLRKVVQSEWLKYRYGVLPLINDIKAVLKALDSSHGKVVKTERAKAQFSNSSVTTVPHSGGGWNWDLNISSSSNVSIRAISVDTYHTSVASDLGITPDLVPQTLWELVPFSFVVDWFVNVGDYLYAVIPRVGVEHLGGCVTVEHTITKQIVSQAVSQTIGVNAISFPSCNLVQTRLSKTRTAGLEAPTLVVKRDFRFDNNVRLADAAALIGVQLNRVSQKLGRYIR